MRLKSIARIAKWEAKSGSTGFNKRTAIIVLLASLVGASVFAGAQMGAGGTQINEGLYTVGIEEGVDTGYKLAMKNDPQLNVKVVDEISNPDKYDAAIVVQNGKTSVIREETKRGRAVVQAMNQAIEQYNTQLMRDAEDQAAAFPVGVIVSYVNPVGSAQTQASGASSSGGTGEASQPAPPEVNLEGESGGKPDSVNPPFPFRSLILAFAFLVPINFIAQAYGSSMIEERTNRRGELLLVSPVTRYDIIAGKTIPYLLATLAISGVISYAIGAGLLSVLAVLPLGLAFFGAVFVASIFSRSYNELTFLTLSISVVVVSFAFIPAVFTQIHPISVISPLTIVVSELRGETIALSDFLFSTVPLTVTATLMFGLGAGMFSEKDLFTQKSIRGKLIDALAYRMKSKWSAAKMSALGLPFVFVAELLAVAMLFIAPPLISLPVILGIAAFIEEVAKSLHIFAGFEKKVFKPTRKMALILGFLSGAGFFLAEKVLAVVQYVGLMDLSAGQTAFLGAVMPTGQLPLGILLLFPFLHSITAMISSMGARKGWKWYLASLIVATLVHIGYNVSVLLSQGMA